MICQYSQAVREKNDPIQVTISTVDFAMLAVISPAKRLDFEAEVSLPEGMAVTGPRLADDITQLAKRTKRLTVKQIQELMDLSENLAQLNFDRFQAFEGSNALKPAIHAFKGDVYIGLDADSFSDGSMRTAERQLRILSGLYGLLRPGDLIKPYRLEMGTSLDTRRGKTLYAFWGERITKLLNADLEETGASHLINLASTEYFKAVKPKMLSRPLVTVNFKEQRGDQLKTISFSAKLARGQMARHILENKVDRPEGLTDFSRDGYRFAPELSDDSQMLFVRPQPEPAGKAAARTA